MNLTFEMKELLSILTDPKKTEALKMKLKELYTEGFGFVLPEPKMDLVSPEPKPEKETPQIESKKGKNEKSETVVKNDVLKAVKTYLTSQKENVNASDTLKTLFAKYNAKRVSELKESDYGAFLSDLENIKLGDTA